MYFRWKVVFIRPSRDGPYYVIGYGMRAGVHTGFRTITLVLYSFITPRLTYQIKKMIMIIYYCHQQFWSSTIIKGKLILFQTRNVCITKYARPSRYGPYYVIGYGMRAAVHTGFRTITLVLYIGSLPSLATWLPCGRGRTLCILRSLCQRSRSLTINIIFVNMVVSATSSVFKIPGRPIVNDDQKRLRTTWIF
jgi:hypothetical protein